MTDNVWPKSISLTGLLAGWHLARSELQNDFVHDRYATEAFAYALNSNLREISRLLRQRAYTPQSVFPIPVPKGTLGTRPGSLIPLRDRIVLWSIIRNIAPLIDPKLHDGVYSNRLKNNPSSAELFDDLSALDVPFLKNKSIKRELNPLDAWYNSWPKFSRASHEAVLNGYNYLSVTDISAYFENINHTLLKEHLMTVLNSEDLTINLIISIFSHWITETSRGQRPDRGIPQGSTTSSYFGNIYLMPIDEHFHQMAQTHDIIYNRYMDDIRVFSKNIATARKVIFDLEQQIRRLHLNVQTAKTKILKGQEIIDSLIDDRITKIREFRQELRDQKNQITLPEARSRLRTLSNAPSKMDHYKNVRRLAGRKKSELSDRFFRMVLNTANSIGDSQYLNYLYKELEINPDPRSMNIYVNSCKAFPNQNRWQKSVLSFLESDLNIFPYQESQFLNGARYFYKIEDRIMERASNNLFNTELDFYLRMESASIISQKIFTETEIRRTLRFVSRQEHNSIAATYFINILGQAQAIIWLTYQASRDTQCRSRRALQFSVSR